jgi:hypothetical protein
VCGFSNLVCRPSLLPSDSAFLFLRSLFAHLWGIYTSFFGSLFGWLLFCASMEKNEAPQESSDCGEIHLGRWKGGGGGVCDKNGGVDGI